VWAHWDVEELIQRKKEFDDPGHLKVGLQGCEHLEIVSLFDKIREKDAERSQ
jgi:hypothetical protein